MLIYPSRLIKTQEINGKLLLERPTGSSARTSFIQEHLEQNGNCRFALPSEIFNHGPC
jgi:hypothetical protein